MQNVSYNIGPETVTIYSEGRPYAGQRTPSVLEAIKAGDIARAIALLSPVRQIAGLLASYGDIEISGDAITFKGRALNNASAARILELARLGLPLESEARFLQSLMRHDDPRVIESMEDFIQRWNIPRTNDGRLVLVKGVRADFKDGHTGTVDWSVGQTVRLPWSEIDRNPENTCSRGLHAAPLEGARSYASRDGHLLELWVWPEHVGALPYDYKSCGKVRVVEAYVAQVIPKETAAQFYDFLVRDTGEGDEDETGAYNPESAFDDGEARERGRYDAFDYTRDDPEYR